MKLVPLLWLAGCLVAAGCSSSEPPATADAEGESDARTLDQDSANVGSDAGADSLSDSGACVYKTWSVPGCSEPPNGCQDMPDACLGISTFCGCDGVTFNGGCGFAQRPFRSEGACPDAGP